jgi:hypothetical protein
MTKQSKIANWMLVVSGVLGLLVAFPIAQPILPDFSYLISNSEVLAHLHFEIPAGTKRKVGFETPRSGEERSEALHFQLQAMSDNRLMQVSIADRPCKDKVMNECYGFSDKHVARLAAEERKARAEKIERDLKERDQNSKDLAVIAAQQSVQAAKESADAAKKAAEVSERNLTYVAIGAFAAVAGVCLTLLAWLFPADQKQRAMDGAKPAAPNQQGITGNEPVMALPIIIPPSSPPEVSAPSTPPPGTR